MYVETLSPLCLNHEALLHCLCSVFAGRAVNSADGSLFPPRQVQTGSGSAGPSLKSWSPEPGELGHSGLLRGCHESRCAPPQQATSLIITSCLSKLTVVIFIIP